MKLISMELKLGSRLGHNAKAATENIGECFFLFRIPCEFLSGLRVASVALLLLMGSYRRWLVLFSLCVFYSQAYTQQLGEEIVSINKLNAFESNETSCPALTEYYLNPKDSASLGDPAKFWAGLEAVLSELMPRCLRSSEYFALLGASQLNSSQNSRAIESLERSLLLDPGNGAARVDYAQALYNAKQLFSALEINEELLSTDGLPEGLLEELRYRNDVWRSETMQTTYELGLSGGYDSNLNGAPNVSEIMLTLSGEDVSLALGNEFQSTSGGYANMFFASRYQVNAPGHRRSWTNELRGRLSRDERSDMLRVDSRYSFLTDKRKQNWQVDGGLSHLSFGGNSLYSAMQLTGRYVFNSASTCNSSAEIAGQRQYFHQQNLLDAVEAKVSGGLACDLGSTVGPTYSRVSIEFGLLANHAISSIRPGGHRRGWQAAAQWQAGPFLVQASRTFLKDERAYSPILANGDNRRIARNQVVFQYRKSVRYRSVPFMVLVNLYHQNQASNINLFSARDTSLELGLSFNL